MSLPTEKPNKQDPTMISGFHQDLELLRNAFLFRDLEYDCLKILAMLCYRIEFETGDIIVTQDEENDKAFLVISGQISAVYKKEQDQLLTISSYGPEQLVYSCALLCKTSPLFTLKAIKNTEVLSLRREEFQKTLQQFPLSMIRITESLVSELAIKDANLLKRNQQGSTFDYQAIGISLL